MTLARWSAHERLALVTASRVSASLSIIGAAFVLFAGAFASRFARGRTFIFVRRIACADFGFALAAIFGDLGVSRPLDRPSAACVTQGFFIQTFGVAGAMWSAVVAKELRDAGRGALASSNALARRAARYDFIVWGVCVVLACDNGRGTARAAVVAQKYTDKAVTFVSEGERKLLLDDLGAYF